MTTNDKQLTPVNPTLPARRAPAVEGELALPTDTLQPMRVGLWVLGLGFGGFLLWAGLAPLDEGVPAQGMVTLDTKRKAVQHQTGGIIRNVLVGEGQQVKEGDPLLVLDDAMAKAGFESVRQRYLGLRAMEGRLLAEQSGAAKITFHPDLLKASNDPLIQTQMDNQAQLFRSRRAALDAELRGAAENLAGQEAALRGNADMQRNRSRQRDLLLQELEGIRDLVAEGYAPRNRLLELERNEAELGSLLADLQSGSERLLRGIAEMKLRITQRREEYRKEVDTQLADVQREVLVDAEKYKAAEGEFARTVIRAPSEGQVVGLAMQTVGGVVAPGQKLMDIVPRDEALLIEAQVPPQFVDRVKTGMVTDVRFSAFAHSPSLVVPGKIDSVSGDLISDPHSGAAFFLARLSVTPEGLKELGDRKLQPGMPVEVIIKTGERTVLEYLLHPLTKRMSASMKEE